MHEGMKRFAKGVESALKRTTQAAETYAKLSRLYKSHTYGLRSSIKGQMLGPHRSQVGAHAKYAPFVEYGTKPHEIRPKRISKVSSRGVRGSPQWLRFEQNGTIVFTKLVKHPGTKPRPFMQEARDRAEPLFDRLCREAANRMF